ncbi:MAG: methyltransferase domain-containing protein [Acidobacteria bacterium]|nr:methyltransferase domain-containing protein [Acidobacteriota bacterium]
MQRKLLRVLACPGCHGELSCRADAIGAGDDIEAGALECAPCRRTFPIERGIPRFVAAENYASSFGYQWTLFKAEQIDGLNGTGISADRFYSETGWTREWLSGKWILDVGCGAGRFLDVVSRNACDVVGLDLSAAVDAARATLARRANVHLVQASIYELPFRSGVFDGCYCIGVIQHTPDPARSLESLPRVLKPRGRVAVTIYERKPWTMLNAKYLVRPLTRRLPARVLSGVLRALMPVVFPLTELVFRLPYIGRAAMFAIPIANYVHERRLTLGQRYRWAIMDTFDMLAPEFDQPQRERDAREALVRGGVGEIARLPVAGLNLVGAKQ